MKRKIQVETLLFPKMLELLGQTDERLAVDETVTAQTLNRVSPLLFDKTTGPMVMFTVLARTATLFLVDHDEFKDVVESAGDSPLVGLPPLPYPRMAVECWDDSMWSIGSVDDDQHPWNLPIFMISETERGVGWNVCFLLQLQGGDESYLYLYGVHADGTVHERVSGDGRHLLEARSLEAVIDGLTYERVLPPDDERGKRLRRWPIEFAHLVNAKGVSVEPLDIPRGQRRRFERKKLVHPQLYFVYVGDGTSDDAHGHSDREYHCRWMVRGHWYHQWQHPEHGNAMCSCPEHDAGKPPPPWPASWKQSHIKGPAGAPWKGRPIYVVFDEDEAA